MKTLCLYVHPHHMGPDLFDRVATPQGCKVPIEEPAWSHVLAGEQPGPLVTATISEGPARRESAPSPGTHSLGCLSLTLCDERINPQAPSVRASGSSCQSQGPDSGLLMLPLPSHLLPTGPHYPESVSQPGLRVAGEEAACLRARCPQAILHPPVLCAAGRDGTGTFCLSPQPPFLLCVARVPEHTAHGCLHGPPLIRLGITVERRQCSGPGSGAFLSLQSRATLALALCLLPSDSALFSGAGFVSHRQEPCPSSSLHIPSVQGFRTM